MSLMGYEPPWLLFEERRAELRNKTKGQLLTDASMGVELEHILPLLSEQMGVEEMIEKTKTSRRLAHEIVSFTPFFHKMRFEDLTRLLKMHEDLFEKPEFFGRFFKNNSITELLVFGLKEPKWINDIIEYFIHNLNKQETIELKESINSFFIQDEEYAKVILSKAYLLENLDSSALTTKAKKEKHFADAMLYNLDENFAKLNWKNLIDIGHVNVNYALFVMENYRAFILSNRVDFIKFCIAHQECAKMALEYDAFGEALHNETRLQLRFLYPALFYPSMRGSLSSSTSDMEIESDLSSESKKRFGM